jgi:hypothetical protein
MQVVDFVEGIDTAFPVGSPVRPLVLHDMHRLDIVELEMVGHFAQKVAQRHDIVVHRDEDQPCGDLAAHLLEVGAVAQDIRMEGVCIGDALVLAVEAESPTVEGADELAGAAEFAQHQLAAAVRADIVEGIGPAILAAHDDKRFAADLEAEPVSRVRNVANHPGKQPGAGEHTIPLRLPELA